jgi:hypothetical protein
MDDNKVVRFPTNSSQRWRNRHGKFSISCLVSGRYLRFDKKSEPLPDGNYVFMDVMTDDGEKPRKLCQLCISKQDLRAVLERVD